MRAGESSIGRESFVEIGSKRLESSAGERIVRSQDAGKMPGIETFLCGGVEISMRDLIHAREPHARRIRDHTASQNDYKRGPTSRCRDFMVRMPRTIASPSKPPREYERTTEAMPHTKTNQKSMRSFLFFSDRARKKRNGSVILTATARKLLSSMNEPGGPQTRSSPAVRRPKMAPLTAKKPMLSTVT